MGIPRTEDFEKLGVFYLGKSCDADTGAARDDLVLYDAKDLTTHAVIIGMTPVFAYITFSQDVLYPTYEYAPRITSLTAAADQLLAGSMMKLIGMAVAMIAFGVSFYRWYQATERKHPALGKKR